MRTARPNVVLAVVCAALLVVVIDVTVLHTAIPAITGALRPTSVQVLWIVDIYPLVVAPLLLTAGFLGDKFGRKKLLVAGLVGFGAASALAAFAPDAYWLIVARAFMAIGAAMIMPATMALLRAAYPDRRQRLRAVAAWSAVAAAGAAAGPLVGGLLVEGWWWGAVFLINVPLCAVVAAVALAVLTESRSAATVAWDSFSAIVSVVTVLSLVIGVKEIAATHPWIAATAFAVSAVTGIAFVRRQLAIAASGRRPMLDVRLFQRRPFAIAVGCVLLAMFGVVGLDLIFAQYLQYVLGLSPIEAALRLLPLAGATIIGSISSAHIINRAGSQTAIVVGLIVAGGSLIPLITLGATEQLLVFSLSLAVLGFALEVALVSANDIILSAVPADRAGEAAGIEETAYDLGGGLGVAVLGSVFATVYTRGFQAPPGHPMPDVGVAASSIGDYSSLPEAIRESLQGAANAAFIGAFHAVIALSVAILVAAGVAAAVINRRTPTTESSPVSENVT